MNAHKALNRLTRDLRDLQRRKKEEIQMACAEFDPAINKLKKEITELKNGAVKSEIASTVRSARKQFRLG